MAIAVATEIQGQSAMYLIHQFLLGHVARLINQTFDFLCYLFRSLTGRDDRWCRVGERFDLHDIEIV